MKTGPKIETVGSVEVELPIWSVQIEIWATEDPDWWDNFKSYLDTRKPSNVRGDRAGRMDWNRERFYELVYVWNNYPSITASDILAWWIKKRLLKSDATLGSVEGMIRRLTARGITTQRGNVTRIPRFHVPRARSTDGAARPPLLQRFRSTREIMEMRRNRVAQSGGAFDSLSREERGLPSVDMARQQHPDHAEGITYDTAHRLEHGRTSLFAEEDRKLVVALRRLMDLSRDVNRILPEDFQFPLADYVALKPREREMVQIAFLKLLPRLRILISTIENLPSPDAEISVLDEADLRIIR